mgnify:CR=1 FL=1
MNNPPAVGATINRLRLELDALRATERASLDELLATLPPIDLGGGA